MKDVALTPQRWSGQPHSVMEWIHPHLQLNEMLLLHPLWGNKAQKTEEEAEQTMMLVLL